MHYLRAFLILSALLSTVFAPLSFAQTSNASAGPCDESINELKQAYSTNSAFRKLVTSAFRNIQPLPPEYHSDNPWKGSRFSDLVSFLTEWCTFLPTVKGSTDTGLKFIKQFAWFYYQNESGKKLVQESPGREILQNFVRQRGEFMNSKASTVHIASWLKEERIEKEDYHLPDENAADGGFRSFNEFFARTLKDPAKSRPQTMPTRDYVISAPTDCIMNSIPQKITNADTLIPIKFNQALNIRDLLDGSEYADSFVGGTALSCVLMPNTYHHYHSPVGGKVVESKIVRDAFFGYDNFPAWVPANGNVGYHGTDFSQFENFQRGYFIVDTGRYGHVALIPVGLNTISSVVFEKQYLNSSAPVPVKRGDRLGHFLYGGSLFLMVFEPGRYKSDAIQVRLGNQIGIFDTELDSASDPQ